EVEVGVRSLAVPFFDNKQKVAGAITALTSMSAVTTKKLLSDILPIVQNVADQLQIAMKAGRSDIQS
ncbi:IclR family transcriptional regulator C-terminal domain-containing protein, partial [Xanthomonas citri pv. mangiferaeindicae]|uniref:IclR family transcriptional regulator domain-containing protein n=1 Tax=Xanthomonas citri TaxID=346 RepID=UPI003F821D44